MGRPRSMTLREAAAATSRSVTTLRRYLRSGRLAAEMRHGRYGPEYYVTDHDLQAAGLSLDDPPASDLPVPTAESGAALVPAHEAVPADLFRELQMKHEQLLVQYGMMRAGGLRMFELQGELDEAAARVERLERERSGLEASHHAEVQRLQRRLREAELELESRRLENEALRTKLRELEALTRRAVSDEVLERQLDRVADQAKRVDKLERLARGVERSKGRSEPIDH